MQPIELNLASSSTSFSIASKTFHRITFPILQLKTANLPSKEGGGDSVSFHRKCLRLCFVKSFKPISGMRFQYPLLHRGELDHKHNNGLTISKILYQVADKFFSTMSTTGHKNRDLVIYAYPCQICTEIGIKT